MGRNWRYLLRLSRLLKDELFEMLQDYPKEFYQKIDQVYDLVDPKSAVHILLSRFIPIFLKLTVSKFFLDFILIF